jgi:hypothetical protein
MTTRPTIERRSGTVENSKDFSSAFKSISAAPARVYKTQAGTPFTAIAKTVTKGSRLHQEVIIFKQDGKEMARAYEKCWGHTVNCNRTYIDSYTPVI